MRRKSYIILFTVCIIAAFSIVANIFTPEKDKTSSYTELPSSDVEQSKTQTRADLIFLELLQKTLFRSN